MPTYKVKNGKIIDEAGVVVSKKAVAADAVRAAKAARANAETSRSFHPARPFAALANKKLQQDAENARDAIRKANSQTSSRKKK